jgi:intracellular sulfur oxidation DsrE/DsrF family protein
LPNRNGVHCFPLSTTIRLRSLSGKVRKSVDPFQALSSAIPKAPFSPKKARKTEVEKMAAVKEQKTVNGVNVEELEPLKEIAIIISRMSKVGIRVEVCVFALKVFGVEPASILPEIERVGNGWISEIGYQARGYSLVPVY